jgi:hypothetical protein
LLAIFRGKPKHTYRAKVKKQIKTNKDETKPSERRPTMKWLTIDYIKEHVRIDSDCEDSLLELYGDAAEETALNLMNRTEADLIEEYGKIPTPIMQATLMLVDVSYTHRSPDSPGSQIIVPYTFDLLIKPYCKL